MRMVEEASVWKALLTIDRAVEKGVGSHQSELRQVPEMCNYWLFLLSNLMGQCHLSAKFFIGRGRGG